jgi:hypothetical protein
MSEWSAGGAVGYRDLHGPAADKGPNLIAVVFGLRLSAEAHGQKQHHYQEG